MTNFRLGECRTLRGVCEQAACIIATKERLKYRNVSEMTIAVGSMWWHIASCSLAWHIASMDCQVSIHCNLSTLSFWSFLLVVCIFDAFSGSILPC